MEKKSGFLVSLTGIVQGVGFRPFVYNLAIKYGLTGYVKNTLNGVDIVLYGFWTSIQSFLNELKVNKPPLAVIKSIVIKEISFKEEKEFKIQSSESAEEKSIFISPDIGMCIDCQEDFINKNSRFFRYPFVTCTNCGPRFSIIESYPYDRVTTTMKEFEMCNLCKKDYKDIRSRRYHAETISCKMCGPEYFMLDGLLKKVEVSDIWRFISEKIKEGKIIAVKGIGGYHLVLDAKNLGAVSLLRQRKKRDRKPFALLMKDIEIIKEYCYVSDEELKILNSYEKPIVLLKKRKSICQGMDEKDLLSGTSPYYGVMLPYSPVHYLLTEENPVLVCTSANISGEPIVYQEEDLERVRELADYFLVHNRKIVRFVEDSVIKVSKANNKNIFLFFRKSRGYAPKPLFLKRKTKRKIMGVGSDLKSTISFIKEDVVIQSQYLGDLADYQSYEGYIKCFFDFQNIFMFQPDFFVCDLHPAYLSRDFIEKNSQNKKVFYLQHHKAHIASVMIEKNIYEENVLGLALDGTGYGEDGNIWGGEIFVGNLKKGLKRVGGLSYLPLPFGDKAVKEPERTFISYFLSAGIDEEKVKKLVSQNSRKNFEALKKIIEENSLHASSTGRLFDAVSYLLGFRDKVSYEGEPAIELENLIYKVSGVEEFQDCYKLKFNKEDGRYVLDSKEILRNVFIDYENKIDIFEISIRFHSSLVLGLCKILKNLAKEYEIKQIVLSGGSFQNQFLVNHFYRVLENEGFKVFINEYSPPNDACISVGQCAYYAFRD